MMKITTTPTHPDLEFLGLRIAIAIRRVMVLIAALFFVADAVIRLL